MVTVEYKGVYWEVYLPLSQIYLEGSREDLWDFLSEESVRKILSKAQSKQDDNNS